MVQNIEKHAVFVNQAYIFAHIVTKLQKYILAIDQFHINLFFVVCGLSPMSNWSQFRVESGLTVWIISWRYADFRLPLHS